MSLHPPHPHSDSDDFLPLGNRLQLPPASSMRLCELEPRVLFSGVVLDAADLTADVVESVDDLLDLDNSPPDSDSADVADVVNEPPVVDGLLEAEVSQIAVAMSANGDYVLSWSQASDQGNGWDVFAQVYQADGTPLTAAFQVNEFTVGDQEQSSVAVDSSGNLIVCWTSDNQDGSGSGIYARIFDCDGTARSAEVRVNTTTVDDQFNCTVAASENGQFFVFWQCETNNDGSGGSTNEIVGQRLDIDGSKIAGEFTLQGTATHNLDNPSISVNRSGDFAVAWVDAGTAHYQQFEADGRRLSKHTTIASATSVEHIDVWLSDDGAMVATWSESHSGQSTAYFQLVGADQEIAVNKTQVSPTLGFDEQGSPVVSGDGGGNFIIVWQGDSNGELGLYANLFDSDGQSLRESTLIAAVENGSLEFDVALRNLDDFVVAWTHEDNGSASSPSHRLFYTDAQAEAQAVADIVAIDGIMEGVWSGADSHAIENAVAGNVQGYSANFSALWDDDNLYLALKVLDQDWSQTRALQWQSDRAFEILFDANSSREFQIDGADDVHLQFNGAGTTVWAVAPDGSQTPIDVGVAVRAIQGGYVAEISIPWTLIGVEVSSGDSLGMEWLVHRVNPDQPNNPATLAWGATVSPSSPQPVLWGSLQLQALPADSGQPPPPQDANDSIADDLFSQLPTDSETTDTVATIVNTQAPAPTEEPAAVVKTLQSTTKPIRQVVAEPAPILPASETTQDTAPPPQPPIVAASEVAPVPQTEQSDHNEQMGYLHTSEVDTSPSFSERFDATRNELLSRELATTHLAMDYSLPQVQKKVGASINSFVQHATAQALVMPSATTSFLVMANQVAEDIEMIRTEVNLPTGTLLAAGVTSAVTVGYVTWLIRGGLFVAGMVTTIPAWQSFDPLPVLQHQGAIDDDGETLETIISAPVGNQGT